jgi:uncharacterized membrane protein HdeD (DUF308 family)
MMAEQTPLPTCPMQTTCRSMMAGRMSGIAMWIPGIVLIALGVLIVFEPRILAWVIAAAFVFMGAMMLMMAGFMRRMGARFRSR